MGAKESRKFYLQDIYNTQPKEGIKVHFLIIFKPPYKKKIKIPRPILKDKV